MESTLSENKTVIEKAWRWAWEHPITILNAVLPPLAYLLDLFGEHYVCWHVGIVTAASVIRDVWKWSKSQKDAQVVAVIGAGCPDKQERPPEPPALVITRNEPLPAGAVEALKDKVNAGPFVPPAQEQTYPPLVLKFDPWGYWFIDALPENIDPPKHRKPIRAKKKHKRKRK